MAQLMTEAQKAAGLDAAVNAAAEQLIEQTTQTEEQQTEETQTEETEAEQTSDEETSETTEETEETSDDDELNDEQIAEARRLYGLLKNPKTAGPLIAALAQDAGILNQEKPLTQKQEEKAAKAIKQILSESLGKEFSFLADRLAPAIEEIVGQVNERQESVVQQQQLEKITAETIAATEKLSRETKGASVKLEKRMQELADEMPPGKGISVERYVRRLYQIAAAEVGQTPIRSNTNNTSKVRSNANNAADRLHGTTTGGGVTPKIPNKKMNINESVNFAFNELSKGK